jgi:hypothetical protein
MKKLIMVPVFAFCLVISAFSQEYELRQLVRLEAHLSLIREEALLGRNIGGGVLIGTGVLLGAGGVILSETIPDVPEDERLMYDVIFAAGGGVAVIGGVLVLCLPTDFEALPERFSELPQDTPENMQKKISTGEIYLDKLAYEAESGRYVGGGIMIATGLAELAFYLFVPPDNNTNLAYVHDMFLYQGILHCGLGMLRLCVKSSAENEREAYKSWKRTQGLSQTQSGADISLAVIPTYRGVSAVVRVSF